MDSGGDGGGASQSVTYAQTIKAASSACQTDSGSWSLHQAGNFGGGSFAFACLAYSAGVSETFSATASFQSSGTFSASGSVVLSGSDSGNGSYGSITVSDSAGDGSNAGQVLTGSQTQSASSSLSGSDSFSLG